MTSPFRSGELYGDGAGAARALGLAMATGLGDPVFVDHQCDLLLYGVTAGTAPTAVQLDVQISHDGGTTYTTMPLQYLDEAGVDQLQDRTLNGVGAGPFLWRLVLPHEVLVRFRALRVGGDGTTTLLLVGTAREQVGNDPAAAFSAGAADDVNISQVGGVAVAASGGVIATYANRAMCFDDGAGAARAIGAATWTDTAGTEWHDSGQATFGSLDVVITAAGGETIIRGRIIKRQSAAVANEFMLAGTNNVVGGAEDVDPHYFELPLTTGNISLQFPVHPSRQYKVQFYRANGGPTALAWFDFSR